MSITTRQLPTRPPPEPGQLVEVRRRQWVVSDVEASALLTTQRRQHLVTLVSVEDDAFDEQLEVIWELEAGARVYESGGMPEPTGFDPPHYQQALLDAVRWGAVTNADTQALQSPFRSGITIEDYQLDPVVRAIQMPRVNLLLADDVGLGKTIEAGLVLQELMLRHRARTALVVCPASLQVKWRDEMQEKFGLDFRIVDTELLRVLRRTRGIHANPWTHFPRLITSIDWLKRDGPMRSFVEAAGPAGTYPRKFDMLIVDEAHNAAPAGSQHYSVDSMRTKAVRRIAPHFEHRLFLTATPHNGYDESFSSLLELLDDQRFARGVKPADEQLRAVMVRRLKTSIVDWAGERRFATRRIEPIEVAYSEQERSIHAMLREYSEALHKIRSTNAQASEFVAKLLKKRLFSSPAAFASTLEKHRLTISGKGEQPSPRGGETLGILRRAIEEVDEDYADDEQAELALEDAVGVATHLIDYLEDRELQLLSEMSSWADRAKDRADAKANALIAWLERWLKPGGEWSNERAIIFTEYRSTQNWLVEILTARGFGGDRLETLYGGMDPEARERVKAAFQADPDIAPVRLLVATDAASEGIDLQNHCRLMVHFEIPWNPNRMEQRNGRIDRFGQKASEVLIHHFVAEGYAQPTGDVTNPGSLEGELEFLYRVAHKVEAIREDLGQIGPVIADQVEEVMRGQRTALDTASAERRAESARRVLRIERNVRERVSRLHDRLIESRESLHFTPDALQNVVEVGLELASQPPVRTTEDKSSGSIVFGMPALGGTWARCTEGLEHPHTGRRRPITFDGALAAGRDDLVLVHLSHRLADMCQRLLRSEGWAPAGRNRLHRVSAREIDDAESADPAVIVHARLVVQGRRGHRLHEELISAGGFIVGGGFRRFETIGQLDRIWERSAARLPTAELLTRFQAVWPRVAPSLLTAIEARQNDRMQFVGNTVERRRDGEVTDIRGVLEELRQSIQRELDAPPDRQLTLWTDTEREQLRRNEDALRERVAMLPQEADREAQAIIDRYADPVARVFPVSVTFVAPKSMVR